MRPEPSPTLRERSRRRTVFAAAMLVLVGLGAAAACTSDSSGDADGSNDDASSDTVVLVTYDSFALPDDAAAAFEEQTGATIEVVATGDSGTMLTRALLAAGAPDGDVIFGIDNTLATRALSEDLLAPLDVELGDDIPAEVRLEGSAGDLLAPIDTGDVCMNVDQEWFSAESLDPPTTLEELADPRYEGLTVVESPVTSSPGLAFLLGTVARYGESGWQDYWQRLSDNDVRVRPSWDDAYYSDYTVSGGDRPIVLSYASSPPAEVIFSEGERTEPASSVLLDSCSAQVEYAGVLSGAANPELAQELVEFMLSPVWQESLPMSNFVFPAVVGTALPEEFTQWAERAPEPLRIPADSIDEHRDEWIEQWRELME